jgi:hypothetical protein
LVKDDKAVALDWKTGKRKMDSDQLLLMAAFLFTYYPKVSVVDTGFVWLKENKIDRKEVSRNDVGTIWGTFVQRSKRLETAYEQDVWLAKPSGLCNGWCPVPRRLCEFSKGKK